MKHLIVCVFWGLTLSASAAYSQETDANALIKEALSAAPPEIASNASVHDWNGNVLRGGYGDWICYPTPPGRGSAKCPMCLDAQWREFVKARASGGAFSADTTGIAYMLAGDCPVSNVDPNAEGPTAENQWINAEGPHLMLLLPDSALLEGMSTDPYNGRPYVMWKDTSFAHVMVPTAGNHPHHGMMSKMHKDGGQRKERHGGNGMMQKTEN